MFFGFCVVYLVCVNGGTCAAPYERYRAIGLHHKKRADNDALIVAGVSRWVACKKFAGVYPLMTDSGGGRRT